MLVVIIACFVNCVEITREITYVNVLVRIRASCLCLFVNPRIASVWKIVDCGIKINVDVLSVRICISSWSYFKQLVFLLREVQLLAVCLHELVEFIPCFYLVDFFHILLL